MIIEVQNWSKQKYIAVLFLFYLIAHGGILFIPNAIYWDDWTLYKVDPEVILDTFQQAGSMFNIGGHMHNLFLVAGPWFYKVLTFILMFSTGIILDNILAKHEFISRENRFLIVLFFLILPFYWARVALIDMPYTVCYFLFFLAWMIIDQYRIFTLLLFFLSFNANSLLVFYALPFLDYYYRSIGGKPSVKSLFYFSVHKLDFVLLPFIYFAVKIFFYPPSGLYEGYNQQYSLLNLFKGPVLMVLDWMKLELSVFAFLLLTILFYVILRSHISFPKKMMKRTALVLLLFGLAAIILAGFPYWIVGHIPTFSEWTSRHQLLFPLGGSLSLVALLVAITVEVRQGLLAAILSIMMLLNLVTYVDFYFDWQKQKALIALMGENELIRNADLIVFDDRAHSLNAINRTYRNYEWNGLLANSFGDESRFGLNHSELNEFIQGNKYKAYFTEGEKYRNAGFDPTKELETVLVSIHLHESKLRSLLNSKSLVKIEMSKLPKKNIQF